MNKSQIIKELKSIKVELLADRCIELHNEGIKIPPSIIKRLSEYERVLNMLEFDKSFNESPIAGVDEAGRGPLAGSVYTAAVIFPPNTIIEGINDSKKLSEKTREELFEIIIQKALAYEISAVDSQTIDEINIRNATYKGMNMAVENLKITPKHVLIDGDAVTGMYLPHTCVIKGDSKSLAISAASILAKVSRDRYIKELDIKYPEYGFAKHKGYGTKEHIEALKKFGPLSFHRKTFIKNFIQF